MNIVDVDKSFILCLMRFCEQKYVKWKFITPAWHFNYNLIHCRSVIIRLRIFMRIHAFEKLS